MQEGSFTISALSSECAEQFDRMLAEMPRSEGSLDQRLLLEDAAGRFRIWASNLGALQPSGSPKSLDFRLRESSLMQASVRLGLERLHRCILKAVAIFQGKAENRVAEESDDADETQPPQRTQPSPQKQ
ncbi:hypothetical protein B0H67DRAFT_558486 [Lasiosphaeris hirsuta]|uniref:Uncharacterized protein n=1 Tax=Lasiosphaeris hirsuta TaxID=260670 RepID=A0AA40DI43_9PEZI|nr:hypothetical protein B0H67DRAFT_558486 [Lasiosphaeris hirsuta]